MEARGATLGEVKQTFALFYIYSLAHLLTHLLMHSFNYSLLSTIFRETGLVRFHYLARDCMDRDTNQLQYNMASVIIAKYCGNTTEGGIQFSCVISVRQRRDCVMNRI